jgi:hypothetical protein
MKVVEFMRLTQGTRIMKEYLHAFNNLSCYAPEFVNTDTKKIASFKRGLNLKMLKTMGTSSRIVFNEFISDCLTQENNNNIYVASKSHKRALELGPSQARALAGGHPQYRSPAPCEVQATSEKESKHAKPAEGLQGCTNSGKGRARQLSWSWCYSERAVLQLWSDGTLF